jgi:hypothetical protein
MLVDVLPWAQRINSVDRLAYVQGQSMAETKVAPALANFREGIPVRFTP